MLNLRSFDWLQVDKTSNFVKAGIIKINKLVLKHDVHFSTGLLAQYLYQKYESYFELSKI